MKFKLSFFSVYVLFFVGSCSNNVGLNENNLQKQGELRFDKMTMIPADRSEIPDDIVERYRLDAEILSVFYIKKNYDQQVTIPKNLIDVIHNGLLHIYNSDSDAANEVTNEYKIHDHNVGVSRRLFLTFDDNQPFANDWEKGGKFTGIEEIDNLIEKYELYYFEYHSWESFDWDGATFRSKNPLNHFALAKLFGNLKYFNNASPGGNIIDGDDIEFQLKGSYIKFTFSDGFGDCMSGCIGRYYWTFNVYSDGRVEFVKETGGR